MVVAGVFLVARLYPVFFTGFDILGTGSNLITTGSAADTVVLYANTALQGAVLGMQRALGELQAKGILREDPSLVIPFMERQRLVDKPRFDAMEKQYAQGD
jgi:hypothetical protein